MPLALETVVKQLTDSGIIAPGKLEDFVPPKAHPTSVDGLVAELVKHSQLTPFQAAQVKAGKVRALILGNYTLIDKIGAGGMGQVFKAEHRRLKRVVAIKMLPKEMLKDAAAVARFQREVEAAAKLRHSNIVATDDADEANGVHFLVMEYVEGKDLSALVKKDGPFPVGKAVNYILQAARGLEFAHSKGVIHRDIKPANLLLSKDGVVKILDMGLARIEGDAADHQLTSSGTIMGTVDFMAPEQAISTRNADARADIYSLGISLYYLLSAKPAYGGETAIEKLMAHQTQPIPCLQDVQTTVPKGLDAVFKKMVAKKMEDRYQSMSEVIEALEELGIGASTNRKGEVASTLALSPEQKKKLAATAKKKPLGSLTEKVASEKTKHLVAKIVGGAFATIIAPILVTYFIRYLEKKDEPPKPPAAMAEATVPVVEASNTTSQPAVPAGSGGGQTPSAVPSTAVASSVPAIGTAPPLAKAPFDAARAKAHQAAWAKYLGTKVETTNSVGMRMTLIPPGEFLMGSTPEQVAWGRKAGEDDKMLSTDLYFQRLAEETPQHKVTIGQPFLMGSTEVTVAQFRKFIEASKYVTEAEKYGFGNSGEKALTNKVKEADKGKNWKSPGYANTDDTVVTEITWNDAVAYCTWLSEQEQRRPWYRPDGNGGWLVAAHADGYRLPTEAEWEYACRAGTTTQFSFGDDKAQLEQYGWFIENASGKAKPVALKLPNPFGLFDIHGNAIEWCQDWYDGKWYEKNSFNDPKGPSSGSYRVFRGGHWNSGASYCRSASRYGSSPSLRYYYCGFRIARPLDASQPEAAVATTAKPSASSIKPTMPWETPEFQAWVKATQALPAEKQIDSVSKKLMELNPGFDGKLESVGRGGIPTIEAGMVTGLWLNTDEVTDLSPLRALAGLKRLACGRTGHSKLADLSPLRGLSLEQFTCAHNDVSDLSPLEGMPLTELTLGGTKVTNLSPLRGMPLTHLSFQSSPVADLSPVLGMRLSSLNCGGSNVSDLSPIVGMPLVTLIIDPQRITKGIEDLRRMTSLQTIGFDGNNKWPPTEFWKKYDAGEFGKPAAKKLAYLDPAFQQWVKATQALPAEQQIEAVSKKLMELNPGFDGTVWGEDNNKPPKIERQNVTVFHFYSDKVTDISPVQVFSGLSSLSFRASHYDTGSRLSDLSPLRGMRLNRLQFDSTSVADLSPLKGMPLSRLLCQNTPVSDLSPLVDCKTLEALHVAHTKVTPAQVAALQKALPNCKIGWDDPAKTVAKKLAYLDPAFQQWVKATQALPAEQQIEAVSKKLMELNPGFDGRVIAPVGGDASKPRIKNGVVTELALRSKEVADLSPLQALVGLQVLRTNCGSIVDLSPLNGLQLTSLTVEGCNVADLSPVAQMPLDSLGVYGTKVSNLQPIADSRLKNLVIMGTRVTDLSPLRGMPIKSLNCLSTAVFDLSPLRDCPNLTSLNVKQTKVTPAQVAALQKALPNCKIDWDDPAKPKTPEPAASGSK